MREEIIIANVPRTASTLLYNILRELGFKVKATHTYICTHDKVIIPYRDYRDCLCSWYICNGGWGKLNLFQIIKGIIWVKRHVRAIRKYKDIKPLYLRYEDYINNPLIWYNKLEKYLDMEIWEKIDLIDKYDLKKVKDKVKRFDFTFTDKTTLYRGSHINKGEIGQWKKYIPKRYWNFLYYSLRKELLEFGYGRGFRKDHKLIDMFKQ